METLNIDSYFLQRYSNDEDVNTVYSNFNNVLDFLNNYDKIEWILSEAYYFDNCDEVIHTILDIASNSPFSKNGIFVQFIKVCKGVLNDSYTVADMWILHNMLNNVYEKERNSTIIYRTNRHTCPTTSITEISYLLCSIISHHINFSNSIHLKYVTNLYNDYVMKQIHDVVYRITENMGVVEIENPLKAQLVDSIYNGLEFTVKNLEYLNSNV